MINYKGNFMNQLYKFIEKNPELTLGETLYSILRGRFGKDHFIYASDEELYTALENLNKQPVEEDEPFDEQGFVFWVEQLNVISK